MKNFHGRTLGDTAHFRKSPLSFKVNLTILHPATPQKLNKYAFLNNRYAYYFHDFCNEALYREK